MPTQPLPYHERIADAVFRAAVDLLDRGDAEGLRGYLARHPGVVHQRVAFGGDDYFREPGLLEFIAENPVRHERTPPDIVDVAKVILDAGAAADSRAIDATLGLLASGRVVRECGVQVALIDLLCDHGARADAAMVAALAHGEWEAADALIRRGAAVDLAVAAATGRDSEAKHALSVSDAGLRHRALALAARYGHAGIVGMLLDAGEDPDRYNPAGLHAHSTPLHQAAWGGHLSVVRLLMERRARADIRDLQFHGTPLEWAEHSGQTAIADLLRNEAR
jgi:hypothetical protein